MNILIEPRSVRCLTQSDVARAASISVPILRALGRGEGSLRLLLAVMAPLDLRWGRPRGPTEAGAVLSGCRQEKGLTQLELARRAVLQLA